MADLSLHHTDHMMSLHVSALYFLVALQQLLERRMEFVGGHKQCNMPGIAVSGQCRDSLSYHAAIS